MVAVVALSSGSMSNGGGITEWFERDTELADMCRQNWGDETLMIVVPGNTINTGQEYATLRVTPFSSTQTIMIL